MLPSDKFDEPFRTGVRALLFNCAGITRSDLVYIISNPSTSHIGEALRLEAMSVCRVTEHQVIDELGIHGEEPALAISEKMLAATVIFCLTRMSMAHTQARLRANEKGVKYFSLPDYSADVLRSKAMKADFKEIKNISVALAGLLTGAHRVRLTTALGTDLTMDIAGRNANPAPGFCYDQVLLASPPDAETNIAPNELLTNGRAVIDGSIPCRELGLLSSPITLEIEKGLVKKISGEKSELLSEIFDRQHNEKCRVIAEFGIGLNALAELKGSMLEDEGTLGTVHLGIGSNKTIGGSNDVAFHLDHVIREATVFVDDKIIMRAGVFDENFLKTIFPEMKASGKTGVRHFLVNFFLEKGKFAESDAVSFVSENFVESDLLDSIEFISMISELEEQFGVVFSEDEIQSAEFKTIDGIAEITSRKIQN